MWCQQIKSRNHFNKHSNMNCAWYSVWLSAHSSLLSFLYYIWFLLFHLHVLSCRLMLFRSDRHSSKDWQHKAILGHQSVKLSAECSYLTSLHVFWYGESMTWAKQCRWEWIQCEVIDPTPKSVTYAFMNAFHKYHIHSTNRIYTSIWIGEIQIPKMYNDEKVFVVQSTAYTVVTAASTKMQTKDNQPIPKIKQHQI